MRLRPMSTMPARRPVGMKFAGAVGAVVLGVLGVAVIGGTGLGQLRSTIERLTSDDLVGIHTVDDLAIGVYAAESAELEELSAPPTAASAAAESLDQALLPQLREQLQKAQQFYADATTFDVPGSGSNDAGASRLLTQMGTDLNEYLTLRLSADSAPGGSVGRAALIAQVHTVFDRMASGIRIVRDGEYADTAASVVEARGTSSSTQWQLVIGAIVSLLVALTVVLLLVRDLVPRLRHYGRFAADVAAGGSVGRLDPRGGDELAYLGRALDDMVSATVTARQREAQQAEFTDTLQATASEDEAHELVQRHLERSLPGSTVVVLQRNNSENRLEAATALVPDCALAVRLPGAEPRACLALRLGRIHREEPARAALLSCALCAEPGVRSTCEPLLVGGQVIGSVLVVHQNALAAEDEARIRTSVAQAAPVLGNLRNLALAEFRANSDSLTGLPNKRATEDTLKRMVAQAQRSITPMTAAMLDLDHFKQVNDRFGHAKGDEVLAAVGAALRSCLRASDFAGRFGGEELLVLLPDTTAGDAVALADRIRATVAAITVLGVDCAITVSIGVADLIQHSGDAAGLLRQADRALYTAKAMGRNRVVVAGVDEQPGLVELTGGRDRVGPDADLDPGTGWALTNGGP